MINSSWASVDSSNGSDTVSMALDGFANMNPHTLFVAAAGNAGPGPDKVVSPAAGYNNMSVAALGPFTPYNRPANLSSGGPNDYADPIHGTANDAAESSTSPRPARILAWPGTAVKQAQRHDRQSDGQRSRPHRSAQWSTWRPQLLSTRRTNRH